MAIGRNMAKKQQKQAKARTHRADPRSIDFRDAAVEQAMAAVEGQVVPGCRLLGVTGGQYSLLDLIKAILSEVGDADVIVSTWTAGLKDVQHASYLLEQGHIRSLLLLTDRSFPTRQPEYCAEVCRLFGRDSVILAQTHAKFALISDERWRLVLRTSMNLNQNPRLEYWELDDDPAMYAWFRQLADEIVANTTPGPDTAHAEIITAYELALQALSRTATVAEYAKHRGITVRAVNLAIQEGRCPRNDDGTITVVDADKVWPRKSGRDPTVLRREVKRQDGETEIQEVTLHEAKLRLELARAEAQEAINRERAGEVIHRAEVEAHDDHIAAVIQSWCASLPGRLAQPIASLTGGNPRAIRLTIAAEVATLQDQLAAELTATEDPA